MTRKDKSGPVSSEPVARGRPDCDMLDSLSCGLQSVRIICDDEDEIGKAA